MKSKNTAPAEDGDELTVNVEPGDNTRKPKSAKKAAKTGKTGKPAKANKPGKSSAKKPAKTSSGGSKTSTTKSGKSAKTSSGVSASAKVKVPKVRKQRPSTSGIENVNRIDQNGARFTPGFQVKVRVGKDLKLVTKWFGDKKHGGEGKAKAAAIAWRDEQKK